MNVDYPVHLLSRNDLCQGQQLEIRLTVKCPDFQSLSLSVNLTVSCLLSLSWPIFCLHLIFSVELSTSSTALIILMIISTAGTIVLEQNKIERNGTNRGRTHKGYEFDDELDSGEWKE